ncbi:MAG TPA: alpha-amylase family glycosyl hydrolase [Pyrinomonadaceae bacterium]|nr:alpha-amylase family glycosyl hydrolase [Pyrinomonadaceae bacterium]
MTATAQTNAPFVTKVDPPSWWANHSLNPVRLLVRGRNLAQAKVASTTPGLTISDTRVNAAGTYLFVNVGVGSSVKPGVYPLAIENSSGRTTFNFTINAALDSSRNFSGVTTDDCVYLIMTDRFANGDPSNDVPPGAPAAATDRSNPRAYHGGDLRGVINHLAYLKELGVTAIWLTPWYDNWNGINNCDKPWCPSTYYHGYHAIDYYAVEDRFGDLATLKELVEKAHGLGLKIIQDQVANHVGAHHFWASDSPLPNWFHGTMQNHQLNKFQNSVLLSPHANPNEVRNILDGWFGDDMPDMNQDEPEVARYEIQNSLWWIGVTGIDGIRQDTIQYIPRTFIRDLSTALHRQYPKMWMVGEVFERDAAQTSFFIGGRKGWDGIDTTLDSVFDFSLWNVSLDVFTNKKPVRALRDQLKYDALYPDLTRITTLTNNHDTIRFMSLEGATLEGAMLHTTFMLMVRGTPQLYAGEEIAMEGKEDPDNRRDFPGGFPGDARNAFSASGRTAVEQRMWQWTHDWLALRREHVAIRQGAQTDLFYDDDVYAFARHNREENVIVIINRARDQKNLSLPVFDVADGAAVTALIGPQTSARVRAGSVNLSVPPQTAVAYLVARTDQPQ